MTTRAIHNPILLPGHVYELRVLESRQGVVSGYFDDPALLYQAAETLDGKVAGIYVTMNPTIPALLARAKNRLQTHAKVTTGDRDILRRRQLVIDVDPVRPAKISSSEPEHRAALTKCEVMATWLREQHGWPDPLQIDSGNGGHLDYLLDLPNDEESTTLVKACLEALALKFNDDTVVIDTTMCNAARITKLAGTMACKGDSTDDRPHRRSQILSTPDAITVVSIELLRQLAALRPADPKPTSQQQNGQRFDLQAFLQRHQLVVAREKPWNGGTVFELETCPFNPEHVRDSSIIQFPSGALTFQCFHNSCQAYHWQDLRNRLEPDRSRRAHPSSPSSSEPERTDFTLVAANMVTMKPVKWSVQGRVPVSMLTVLAGRVGWAKSTIALEWAAQMTTGKAAGALAGILSHVIISSTEDTEAETLTPRLTAAHADLSKVHFLHLHRGGIDGSLTMPEDIDLLRAAIQQCGAKFVIIDPLMAHLSARLNSWSDQQLRWALTPLAQVAEDLQVSILVIAHLNKDTTKEVLDRIGGSGGTAAVARSVLFAGPDPDNPEGVVRMLAHAKCNVGALQPTLRYRVEPVTLKPGAESIETITIVWEGEASGVTAEDLVAKPEPISREDKAAAVAWLEQALPVGKKRKQPELETEAKQAGITSWALWKAKGALNVQSKKQGFTHAVWWWEREGAPYPSHTHKSSGKKCANPLKNAKASEDLRAQIFDASSAPEDLRQTQPQIFDKSSSISTPSLSSSLEDLSQPDIRGGQEAPQNTPEVIDLDVD